MQICARCNVVKPDVSNSNRYCKLCHKEYVQEWNRSNPTRYLHQVAKARAKKYSTQFEISVDDIIIPDVCPVCESTIVSPEQGKFWIPHTPSVDRIDSSLGYVKGNVWVICRSCNSKKRDFTPTSLRAFADQLENAISNIKISC